MGEKSAANPNGRASHLCPDTSVPNDVYMATEYEYTKSPKKTRKIIMSLDAKITAGK